MSDDLKDLLAYVCNDDLKDLLAYVCFSSHQALQMVNEATFEAVEANAAADRASRKSARFCAVAAQISKKIEEAAKKHKKQETDETATR